MKRHLTALSAGALALTLAACGGNAPDGSAQVEGDIEPREISWLMSRPADGAILTIMQELGEEYAAEHPGFSLNLMTTPDRPSYLQRLQTLAAANELPELFDTDATPYAAKLAADGRMVDVEELLTDLGLLDSYRANALDYQRFDDGSLHLIPMQYEAEYFWYNTAIFADAGIDVPATLDDFPDMCRALAATGAVPIALNGLDQWPLQRYVTYQPFRTAGPEYIASLKTADAAFADAPGAAAAQWLSDLGEAGCFQSGFTAQGYTDAQNLFTSGRAAVYNIGTWELMALATDDLSADVRDDVDFFTLPTTEGAVTADNEYVVSSGIGMAVNSATYDPLVRDFLAFALAEYPERYAATGALSPTSDVETAVPDNATPLYQKALDAAGDVGPSLDMPWDTQLDPTTNTRLQQELALLVQGDVTPEQFVTTMDEALTINAPRYFD